MRTRGRSVMNAPPLQTRVLAVIREHQPLRRTDLSGWLKDVDSILLDTCVNALLRANKISLTGGYYDVVEQSRPTKAEKLVCIGASIATINGRGIGATPPTADEEAAASLVPATQVCTDCEGEPQPIDNFQIGRGNTRPKICRTCRGKRSRRARAANQADSTAEAPASGQASTHTQQQPHRPQGPPATSSEHLASVSTQGTQPVDLAPANPEALLPVSAGGGSSVRPLSLRGGLVRGREVILDWIKYQEEELGQARKALEDFDRVHELLQDLLPDEFTT